MDDAARVFEAERARRLVVSQNPYRRVYETAGADIEATKLKTCAKCGGELLLGQVRDRETGTLKWRNFARQPVERGGLRFYLRHSCPR